MGVYRKDPSPSQARQLSSPDPVHNRHSTSRPSTPSTAATRSPGAGSPSAAPETTTRKSRASTSSTSMRRARSGPPMLSSTVARGWRILAILNVPPSHLRLEVGQLAKGRRRYDGLVDEATGGVHFKGEMGIRLAFFTNTIDRPAHEFEEKMSSSGIFRKSLQTIAPPILRLPPRIRPSCHQVSAGLRKR